MITVHHLENSRSQRVLWLLEELGLPCTVQRYARNAVTAQAPAELRQVHPLGKSPVLTDDAGGTAAAITVAESGAIVEYLLDAYGEGRLHPPAASEQHRRFVYWLHFAEGSAMPYLLMKLVFDRVQSAKMPFFARPIARAIAARVLGGFVMPNLQRQFEFIESELASRDWFAGAEFSAADVQMSYPVEAAAERGAVGAAHPATRRWLDRIHARPAYARALERGGPYRVIP